MKMTFRLSLYLSILASFFFLICLRLADIQIVKGEYFEKLSQDNRFYTLPLKAQRGIFLDRYGQPLVKNLTQYGLKTEPQALYSSVRAIEREEALFQLASNSAAVARNDFRRYPYPALSHVIGYIGEVTAEEMKSRPDLKPHDLVGKLGLEKFFDDRLRGQDGKEVFEISASSKKQRQVQKTEAVRGQDINTTLDAELSQFAYDALGEQKGVVIVSNAVNGEILALVTKPGFDANLFTKNIEGELTEVDRKNQISALFEDKNQPFFNRAIAGAYPPGSVFKIITALAGLESEKVDAGTTVLDEGVLKIDDFEFRSWYYWSHGRTEGLLGLQRAISRSNDIFFYKTAEWTGVDKLAEMARNFGLGKYTEIEIGPESRGLVPTPEWKEQTVGEKWYLGNTYHMGIGQGDVLTSPLQVSGIVQAVANEGVLCRPHLLTSTLPECGGLGLKTENLALVLAGMLDACSTGGTAFPFFERNAELRSSGVGENLSMSSVMQDLRRGAVACKTGTAEFGAADERGIRPTHGWFMMMVEPQTKKENFPEKITITVMVESDEVDTSKEGSYDAAPVAKEILEFVEAEN